MLCRIPLPGGPVRSSELPAGVPKSPENGHLDPSVDHSFPRHSGAVSDESLPGARNGEHGRVPNFHGYAESEDEGSC